MPLVEIVDMRLEFLETKRQATFSRKLLADMTRRFEAGEQTMLLLNRRGFSSFLVCRACGERMLCQNCSVTLTHHRRDRRMLCHTCGYSEKIPTTCPAMRERLYSVPWHRFRARPKMSFTQQSADSAHCPARSRQRQRQRFLRAHPGRVS